MIHQVLRNDRSKVAEEVTGQLRLIGVASRDFFKSSIWEYFLAKKSEDENSFQTFQKESLTDTAGCFAYLYENVAIIRNFPPRNRQSKIGNCQTFRTFLFGNFLTDMCLIFGLFRQISRKWYPEKNI